MSTQNGIKLPDWCSELETGMEKTAEELLRNRYEWTGSNHIFTPEQYGYTRGESATRFIQQAIDDAAMEGGIVSLHCGDYVSGTLLMKSGVCLEIRAGSRLLGSTDLKDYPEHHARRLTVQDTSMGMHQSLIFAEGCDHICLRGGGILDGQGSQDHFPGDETAQGTPGRPFLIRIIDCHHVHIRNLTMKNAACWMQNYLNCENLHIEGLTVRNHANYNNDGMDIDGCRNVVIRHCRVTSGDDALCFKGAAQKTLSRVLVEDCDLYSACNALKVGTDTQGNFNNVYVRRCRIGGLAEDPSGLKHPCADSGISLEIVDGGTLEDFLFRDIVILRAWSPFFLRLENRGRVKPGDPLPPPGTLRRVYFMDIRGCENGPRGSYMLGIPEKQIEDIAFNRVCLSQAVSGKPAAAEQIDEMRGVYPDAHMIDCYGDAPAYGLWARNVRNLSLTDYRILPEGPESRPEYLLETTSRSQY